MEEDPQRPRKTVNPNEEGMGLGLAVLALIAAACGIIIWAAVYL